MKALLLNIWTWGWLIFCIVTAGFVTGLILWAIGGFLFLLVVGVARQEWLKMRNREMFNEELKKRQRK